MSKIYLASPYSHPDYREREMRWVLVSQLYASLIKQGHAVYCPIAFHHQIAVVCDLPTDHGFWKKQNRAFLEWADIVMVYKLKGWEESEGIQWEVGYAASIAKEVVFEDSI